jgi:crossover junction endodeoxyribonuclease RuvC
MKLLAIDPGYDRIGIAILEKDAEKNNGKEIIVYSTCIQTDKKQTFYERMLHVQQELGNIISEYQPEYVCLEELYFAKNTKTAMRVSEARGIIVGVCMHHNIAVHEIHPNRVKIAITGHGASNKNDILRMLPKLISFDPENKIDDELDAIAIGVAFLAEYRNLDKISL